MYRPAKTLNVGNAKTVLADGLAAIAKGQTAFDLQDVGSVDSSAVATLVAWQRAARQGGRTLVFNNLSSNLRSLIDLYGVSELLSTDAAVDQRRDLPHH